MVKTLVLPSSIRRHLQQCSAPSYHAGASVQYWLSENCATYWIIHSSSSSALAFRLSLESCYKRWDQAQWCLIYEISRFSIVKISGLVLFFNLNQQIFQDFSIFMAYNHGLITFYTPLLEHEGIMTITHIST